MVTPRSLPKEGSWTGQAAYIIGGGPSLSGFNWESLFGLKNVIAINAAYQQVPSAGIWFSEDARTVKLFGNRKDFKAFGGIKLLHLLDEGYGPEIAPYLAQLTLIHKKRNDKFWSKSFDEGLSVSSCSAIGALNVASILGASPIFVLGFDCRSEGAMAKNYHEGIYPKSWAVGSGQLTDYKNDIENWAALNLKNLGIRTVNVINPEFESALTCWDKIPFDFFYEIVGRKSAIVPS